MKTFLVTGAAQGIGRAIVLGLAGPGDRAILNDLQPSAGLSHLAEQLRAQGLEVVLALPGRFSASMVAA
jgi:3-oxoacyl-[acyl-carrier protein] reductase